MRKQDKEMILLLSGWTRISTNKDYWRDFWNCPNDPFNHYINVAYKLAIGKKVSERDIAEQYKKRYDYIRKLV